MTTPKEKPIPDFKKVIKMAQEITASVEGEDGYPSKDVEIHIFEAVMEAIYGKAYWKWWNKKVNF